MSINENTTELQAVLAAVNALPDMPDMPETYAENAKRWEISFASDQSVAGWSTLIASDEWLAQHKNNPSLSVSMFPVTRIAQKSDKSLFASTVRLNYPIFASGAYGLYTRISTNGTQPTNLANIPVSLTGSGDLYRIKIQDNGGISISLNASHALGAGTYRILAAID